VPVAPRSVIPSTRRPRAGATPRAVTLRAQEAVPASRVPGRVLVVEEGHQHRQQLAEGVARRGYAVDSAASPESALKKLEANSYEAIFLEFTPRRTRGLELLAQMLRVRADASIVVMADQSHGRSSIHAAEKGAFHFLTKPVKPEMLDLVLRSCAERSRLLQQNAELRERTIQDDLTSAFNRRYLDAYLDEEVDRSRRYGRTFSILFLDLDHLKMVNDRYGHLAGSRVLREVALLIQAKLRKSDRIFRYGGDEFVVSLPETGATGAVRVANRLRRAVRSHRFLAGDGLVVNLTASFGVATFPQDGASREELIRGADEAMYRVKVRSRDGVAAREA
jgi:diguanylate cyclase (GGDEF)-like protein